MIRSLSIDLEEVGSIFMAQLRGDGARVAEQVMHYVYDIKSQVLKLELVGAG